GRVSDDNTLTMEGTSVGTPVYMAPEQAAGEKTVDHRADIYSVGAMLYEMIAGVAPFSGSLQKIIHDKMAVDAPSLADRVKTAPASIVAVVAQCLARDPADRPQTASDLLARLRPRDSIA